jgi:hypothetical protein
VSSERVEAIGYATGGRKIAVKEYVSKPLLEGTIINGKIIDSAVLVESLSALRASSPGLWSDCRLIVDGSSIYSKRLNVPKLNKWQYHRLILDEFSDTAEHFDELVCDYHMHDDKNGTSIMAYAAEKELVESYISAFNEAGISIKGIHVGMQAIMNYISKTPGLTGNTFILNVVDGVTMLSMIINNGANIFTSRQRLYSDEPEQFVREILANLSGLIQFTKSEKLDHIDHCYYLGITEGELELINETTLYRDIHYGILDIYEHAMGAEKLSVDSHFAYLNTLEGSDTVDLMSSLKTLDKLKKKEKPVQLWLPAFIVVLVLLTIPFTYYTLRASDVLNRIKAMEDYLADEYVVAKSEHLYNVRLETGQFNHVISQAQLKVINDAGIIALSNEALDFVLNGFSNVEINNFSFNMQSGTLSVNGVVPDERTAADYVEFLKGSPLITEISYTGYRYEQHGAVRRYSFGINVVLAARGE